MIGIVIVTHSQLAKALIEAAEFIIGSSPEFVEPVSIDITQNVDKLRGKVAAAVKKVNKGKGILILTDMFGGTPSNLSYSFLEEGKVEVISGVNLPILIKALNSRESDNLSEYAACLLKNGKKSITLASEILKGNKRN